MPRGRAIPEVHERLFAAVERLCGRDGPAGLSSRAVTTEAGCAKGVLHNHFGDFDLFLARFALSRFDAAVAGLQCLPARAGQGEVAANLADAGGLLFTHPVLVAHGVVALRPTVAARLREIRRREHGAGSAGLGDLEQVFARYLEAEMALGRVRPGCDAAAVALTVVATVHHLLMVQRPGRATGPAALARVIGELDVTGERTVRPHVPNAEFC